MGSRLQFGVTESTLEPRDATGDAAVDPEAEPIAAERHAVPGDATTPLPEGPGADRRSTHRITATLRKLWADPIAVGVLALAAVLRFSWAWMANRPPKGLNDPNTYIGYGRIMARTGEFLAPFGLHPTAYFPVGYPFSLSVLKRVGDATGLWGYTPWSMKFVNVVFSLITVAVVMLVGSRLGGRRMGLLAGLVLAIFPSQIFYSGTILSEPLSTMLATCALACLVLGIGELNPSEFHPRLWVIAFGGFLMGCATMTRGLTVLFPAVVAAWWVWCMRSRWRAAVPAVAAMLCAFGLVVGAWVIRNYAKFDGQMLGLSNNAGEDFCLGNAPGATGSFALLPACTEGRRPTSTPAQEVQRAKDGWRIGFEGISSDWGRLPSLSWNKFAHLMNRDDDGVFATESYGQDRFLKPGARDLFTNVANLYYWVVMLVGAVGLFWLGREQRRAWILPAFIVYSIAIILGFFGVPRFHHAMVPWFSLGAAFLLDRLLESRSAPADAVVSASAG